MDSCWRKWFIWHTEALPHWQQTPPGSWGRPPSVCGPWLEACCWQWGCWKRPLAAGRSRHPSDWRAASPPALSTPPKTNTITYQTTSPQYVTRACVSLLKLFCWSIRFYKIYIQVRCFVVDIILTIYHKWDKQCCVPGEGTLMYKALLQLLRSSQCCASGAQACQTPAMEEKSEREMFIINSQILYMHINIRQLHITMKVSNTYCILFDDFAIVNISQ